MFFDFVVELEEPFSLHCKILVILDKKELLVKRILLSVLLFSSFRCEAQLLGVRVKSSTSIAKSTESQLDAASRKCGE